MDISQLKTFKNVVDAGSFTRATTTLHITQPAISHQIRSLENRLGHPLFEKTRRPLRLTHVGEVLYGYAQRILNLVEEAESAIDDITTGETGHISIAAIGTSAIYVLPDFLYTFRMTHPNVHVVLLTLGGEEIIEMVRTDQTDLGIIGSHMNTPDLTTIPLFEDQIRPLVHRDHPAAKAGQAALADLAQEPFIQFGSWVTWRQYVQSIFDQINTEPQEQFQVDSIDAVKRLVERGLGFTIAPIVAAQDEIDNGSLVPIELTDIPPVSRDILLIHRKDKYLTASIKVFIEELAETLGKLALREPGRRSPG